MSDHAIMVLIGAVGFVFQMTGLVAMIVMLRESQRLTREVFDLLRREEEQTRVAHETC